MQISGFTPAEARSYSEFFERVQEACRRFEGDPSERVNEVARGELARVVTEVADSLELLQYGDIS